MKTGLTAISGFVLLALTACSAKMQPMPTPPGDASSIQIAEAAVSVSHSLAELARVEAAVNPPEKRHALPNPDKFHMPYLATIDWSGPIGPLVQKVAHASRFRLRVIGHQPPIPIIITLSTQNTRLADILRDIDFQAGKRAHVKVYPRNRVLELRYAKV